MLAVRSLIPPAKSDVVPPEHEQQFDLLSFICPELGVAPLLNPGTDLEDELPSPDTLPVVIGHGVALLPAQVEEDVDLAQVLAEFGTLSAIVTPIHDPQEERVVSPAEYRTPEAHVDLLVAPAGPTVVPDDDVQPPTGSVGCSPIPLTTPAVPTPEKNLFFLGQPWVDPLSGGEPADYQLPAAPLASRPATVSQPGGELDAVRERIDVLDLSREGPFDIQRGHHHSGASPRLCQDNQGCPFRMTSYDPEKGGPDFSPAYGVQLHDPRLLEYVGAPESARLLSRSEYWVQHMGREKTLSAAFQLQHDAGLILSNVQVLQLVTALNGASSNVMRAVRGRQPFPTHAMQHMLPSYRVRRAAHYMTAMGLWRPPVAPGIRGPLPVATCNACMSCSDCFPDVPL